VVGDDICLKLFEQPVLHGGTDAIIDALKDMDGVLLKEEKIKHKYPYDWKTDKPIIVTCVRLVFLLLENQG
jgi:isoleucyl-tRNA synthetase